MRQENTCNYSLPGPRQSSKESSCSTDWCDIHHGLVRPFDLVCNHWTTLVTKKSNYKNMPIFGTTSSAQLTLALYSTIWEESEVQGKERDTVLCQTQVKKLPLHETLLNLWHWAIVQIRRETKQAGPNSTSHRQQKENSNVPDVSYKVIEVSWTS